MNKELVERFETLLKETGREGINSLLVYLRKTDFYTAPASTRFHNCHEGGLLEHSLNVYDALVSLKENPIWKDAFKDIGNDSLILCALGHDFCKTNTYVSEIRNRKVYSDTGTKRDGMGRYDWESYESYITDDKFPLGHGEKSVFIASEYVKLKPVERYMIRWHMGFTEPKENWHYFTDSVKKHPIVLALHMADLMATYLLEEEA